MSYISLLHQSEMGDSRECAEWCTTTLSGSPAKDFSTRERQHKKKDITHQTRAESFNITQRRMLAEVFILSRQQKECKIKMKILLYRAIYIYQVLCRPPGGGPRLDRRARIQFGAGTFWRKTMKNQPGTMTNQPVTMKNHGNQPKTRKNHENTLKTHRNQPKTMKNHETTLKSHGNQPKTMKNHGNQPKAM